MTTQIFIVTFAPDFQYLKFCLRSLVKFAQGFNGVRILVPTQDRTALESLVAEVPGTAGLPVICLTGDEWPGQGMLWHMMQILLTDQWCPYADFVLHLDADCVFTEPVTPDYYIKAGDKPILFYESFASLGVKHTEVLRWQEVTRNCLPFDPPYETMRQHPEIYHRTLYEQTRKRIQEKTGESVETYLRKQRNEYPQTFCEFVTLGNVAMHDFPAQYNLYDVGKLPWPHAKLHQAWSHRPPIEENLVVYRKAGIL